MALGTRLFVGNLPENTEEKDLQSAFSVFGTITNLDLKIKSGGANTNDSKKFAFISISASNTDVESCIKHFANDDFKGSRLYVTRARESFLERLQRERDQTQKKDIEKHKPEILPKHNPVIKLSDKLNPRKRKIDYNFSNDVSNDTTKHSKGHKLNDYVPNLPAGDATSHIVVTEIDKKKHDSEKKRLESMKKKRQEFKEKQMIIKTGLIGIDKVQNKKVKFSDDEDGSTKKNQENNKTLHRYNHKNVLFDDDDNENDDDVNFDIKKQFEGKKGQKVLDLQSRYKSDKRFTLDERFIDDDDEDGKNEEQSYENGETEIDPADEKAKQMSILQDVLGVAIKTRVPQDQDSKKTKPKLGMLRFDPMQPDHAKFLAPVETKQEPIKKSKKKSKDKREDTIEEPLKPEVPKVEVSKEQFYKVSETLKEAIAQPNTFSFRSMFGNNEDEGPQEQETDYIPLAAPKEKKVKNPLDRREKNPFVYDSSDSETEEVEKEVKTDLPPVTEPKAVWKENLFFNMSDQRILDGLAFFSKRPETEGLKERRELKSLMKKRIYNKDRKNQMFQKKIGGRKKSMKKPYKNKG